MYLKRLELHGFKSFAPRTVLEFSPGITSIVGPNGSGKSNIADSIRWVLGEQSMRQLRGKRSDDVIFAGGQGRATMQMAEVGLVLDNSAGWLPSEFSEVTVARRSFRSGDSEYLINGQRVRLKDVLLLLAQARIGHDSYTVIGQGMVDQALSLRAEERRALFEDAAGIRQFQAQRTDAEQKLALTQSNLSRLRDIIAEIEPRLAPLAEQARRAHEFSGARDELTRLLRIWYRRQWIELQGVRDAAEQAERNLQERITKLQDALTVEDGLVQEARQQRETLLSEIAALRRERSEASNQLQAVERELAVSHERLTSIDRQEADLTAEQDQQADAVAAARAHAEVLEEQLAKAEAQADTLARALESLESDMHAARQEQEREEARLRAAQRDVIQVQARLGAAQTELGRLQRQLGERNRALAARGDALALAQRKLAAAEAQLAERRHAFESVRSTVELLVAQRDQLAQEMAEGQTEIERLRGAAADSQREQRTLQDRLALLQEWQRTMEGFDDGVRALMQAGDDERLAVVGVVAQLLAVSPGLETAVEAALGQFLHAIVVPTHDDARRAANWLRAADAGRALFLWSDSKARQEHRPSDLPLADGEQFFGFARDAISVRGDVHPIITRLLGDTYIVRDLAAAESLLMKHALSSPLVTLEGELRHPDAWMRGGRQHAADGGSGRGISILVRERELRQLPAEIDRLSDVIAEDHSQLAHARTVQEDRRQRIEACRMELQRAEAQAQEYARAVAALQREQERADSEVRLSTGLSEQLAAEVRGLEQEVAATGVRVSEQEEAQRDATERVDAAQEELDDLLARNRTQQEELSRARTALAVQQQEVKATGQRADQLRAQASELELQLSRRGERVKNLQLQRGQLMVSVEEQERALAELRERTRDLSEQLRERDAKQAELERQALELERGQNAERQELARVEVEYRRGIVESQRARDAVEALAQQIREELATEGEDDPLERLLQQIEAPSDEESAQELTADEAAKMRRQIDQLRGRLKHLGGYDPDAPQAFEELRTRYEFLTTQVRDMEQASANLHAVIAELDITMRRQFEETFHAVNARFQRHFMTLFNGGAARLELTAPRARRGDEDDDDEEQTPPRPAGFGGVEVYVQIPGKKVQDLSLLSGGERSMVSAALLFALLETNPPPFCLLDEVDAALDEANVVRFCEILHTLKERTQFIVITHNRVTMTHANAIYGISMGGDSVSRVLSMKLEEVALAR